MRATRSSSSPASTRSRLRSRTSNPRATTPRSVSAPFATWVDARIAVSWTVPLGRLRPSCRVSRRGGPDLPREGRHGEQGAFAEGRLDLQQRGGVELAGVRVRAQVRQHRIAGGGEPLLERFPGRKEGGRQLRTARDDPGKGSLRFAHAPFEVLAVHRGPFRGAAVEGSDGSEEVEKEAAGAPVRFRRFSPGLVETGRRGPEEPLAPPEEREQSGEGERRGPEEPRIERSPEHLRLPPDARLEAGQQLEHARAALGEIPHVGRRRFERSGQSPGSVQLLRGGIEPCVEVREPDVQGGSEPRL